MYSPDKPKDAVQILLMVIRMPEVTTDLLISLNVPYAQVSAKDGDDVSNKLLHDVSSFQALFVDYKLYFWVFMYWCLNIVFIACCAIQFLVTRGHHENGTAFF